MPLDYARATIHTMMRENELGHLEEKKTSFNYHMGVFLHGVYSNYERGELDIPTDILIKLADFHNVSVDYILNRTDIKESNY